MKVLYNQENKYVEAENLTGPYGDLHLLGTLCLGTAELF